MHQKINKIYSLQSLGHQRCGSRYAFLVFLNTFLKYSWNVFWMIWPERREETEISLLSDCDSDSSCSVVSWWVKCCSSPLFSGCPAAVKQWITKRASATKRITRDYVRKANTWKQPWLNHSCVISLLLLCCFPHKRIFKGVDTSCSLSSGEPLASTSALDVQSKWSWHKTKSSTPAGEKTPLIISLQLLAISDMWEICQIFWLLTQKCDDSAAWGCIYRWPDRNSDTLFGKRCHMSDWFCRTVPQIKKRPTTPNWKYDR